MGMKPADDFAVDVGEERPEEAGDGEEGGDEFFEGVGELSSSLRDSLHLCPTYASATSRSK
jgi:hypothetical protein